MSSTPMIERHALLSPESEAVVTATAAVVAAHAEAITGRFYPRMFEAHPSLLRVFADNLGHARQMVFGPDGVLYVNTWSGTYYHNDKVPPGGFLIALKDSKVKLQATCVGLSVSFLTCSFSAAVRARSGRAR